MSQGRTVYLNGQFVPEADARVSVFDSALVWGDMVFETTRSLGIGRSSCGRIWIG